MILELLAEGTITLTAVRLLAPHLTPENHREVLDAARHKSKREIEVLVAGLRPLPPVPSSVRKLPAVPTSPAPSMTTPPAAAHDTPTPEPAVPTPTATTARAPAPPTPPPPSRPAVVAPLTPEQYKVQVTVSRETIEKLRRVQDLMRHAVPNGDPAVIFDRALTLLLEQLERTKLAATDHPRKGRDLTPWSRYVPAHVRRAVWARDGDQCALVSADGHRCQERGFLELSAFALRLRRARFGETSPKLVAGDNATSGGGHHTAPYAAGCIASVATIELRCSAHNKYEAELDFGPSVRQRRRDADAAASP